MKTWARSALALWGLGCAFAVAAPCYREIAGRQPVEFRMADGHERLAVAIPEYDESQDFLFHFYPDGHSVLYAGGLFQESASNEPKRHKTIAHGMAVRVRVGPEAVARIVESLQKRVIEKAIRHYTCHQRLLLVLQTSGIFTARGPALFGSTLVTDILEHGFVDRDRRPYPHTIHVLNQAGEDHFRTVRLHIQSYELGLAHHFWPGVLSWMGYSHEDMLADVVAHGRDPELVRAMSFVPGGGVAAEFDQALRDRAHEVIQRIETKLARDIETTIGVSLRDLLAPFLEHGADDHRAWVRERFRQALVESLGEVARD